MRVLIAFLVMLGVSQLGACLNVGYMETYCGDGSTTATATGTCSTTFALGDQPEGIGISLDEYAFVSIKNNNIIRRITLSTGSVMTYAGIADTPGSTNGAALSSQFGLPESLHLWFNTA